MCVCVGGGAGGGGGGGGVASNVKYEPHGENVKGKCAPSRAECEDFCKWCTDRDVASFCQIMAKGGSFLIGMGVAYISI